MTLNGLKLEINEHRIVFRLAFRHQDYAEIPSRTEVMVNRIRPIRIYRDMRVSRPFI